MGFNEQIIDAFRAGEGEVLEPVPFGRSLGLLHVPKKDGSTAIVPLMTILDGGSWHVVATAAGAPRHPAWTYGMRRADEIDLEVAGKPGEPIRTERVTVTELEGAERDRLWGEFTRRSSAFVDYERKAEGRVFPIFRLTPPDA